MEDESSKKHDICAALACTPVIGWAVEVARGVHLQAPAHAAGRRPAYCRRTACPCRLPLLSSLLPQITIMLTNERCPSATERNGGALAAPVSAATARCAIPDPCAMSRSIPAVESIGSCGHSRKFIKFRGGLHSAAQATHDPTARGRRRRVLSESHGRLPSRHPESESRRSSAASGLLKSGPGLPVPQVARVRFLKSRCQPLAG